MWLSGFFGGLFGKQETYSPSADVVTPGGVVTFLHETCSSFTPYERIPAGSELVMVGLYRPGEGHPNPYVLLAESLENLDEFSGAMAVPLLELLECSNLADLAGCSRPPASARGEAPSP